MLSEDEREEILGVWLSAHMASLKRDHPDFPYEQLLELGSRLQEPAVYTEEHYAAESDCIPSPIPQSISSLQLT